MGKRGPKANPHKEANVIKSFSFKASQWDAVESEITPGERSRLVQSAFESKMELPERFRQWREWRDRLYLRGGTLEKYARAKAERWADFHVQIDFMSLTEEERDELMQFFDETIALWRHPFIGNLMDQARCSDSPLNGPAGQSE